MKDTLEYARQTVAGPTTSGSPVNELTQQAAGPTSSGPSSLAESSLVEKILGEYDTNATIPSFQKIVTMVESLSSGIDLSAPCLALYPGESPFISPLFEGRDYSTSIRRSEVDWWCFSCRMFHQWNCW
jgi:hypothetical protein